MNLSECLVFRLRCRTAEDETGRLVWWRVGQETHTTAGREALHVVSCQMLPGLAFYSLFPVPCSLIPNPYSLLFSPDSEDDDGFVVEAVLGALEAGYVGEDGVGDLLCGLIAKVAKQAG